MAEFRGFQDYEKWLGGRSPAKQRSYELVLGARSALRVLPVLIDSEARQSIRLRTEANWTAIPTIWALYLAWVGAVHPKQVSALARSARSASQYAPNGTSAHTAGLIAQDLWTGNGPDVVLFASFSAGDFLHDAVLDIWIAASQDASRLDAGLHPEVLAHQKLWPRDQPAWAKGAWLGLKEVLIAEKESWEVWIDWYEAVLDGRSSYPLLSNTAREDLEFAIATLPDELWKQDPKVVNAAIKRLITEAHDKAGVTWEKEEPPSGGDPPKLPAEADLPKPLPTAAAFPITPQGVIGLGAPLPTDRLQATDSIRGAYLDCRTKAAELHALGVNVLGERLYAKVAVFVSRTPERIEDAVEREVWSSGNSLRTLLSAHDQVKDSQDPHFSRLDRGAAEALRDLVETFNDLAFEDAALRKRDERRPGPKEVQDSKKENEVVRAVIEDAANNRAITDEAAGEELKVQQRNADDATDDVPGRLAIEHNRDTQRNLVVRFICASYRWVKSLPSEARGEGGFISKEFWSGFYKAAGGGAAVAGYGALGTAIYLRWEILEFVIANIEPLRLYAAIAFENAPGAMQMLDWLEAERARKPAAKNLS